MRLTDTAVAVLKTHKTAQNAERLKAGLLLAFDDRFDGAAHDLALDVASGARVQTRSLFASSLSLSTSGAHRGVPFVPVLPRVSL